MKKNLLKFGEQLKEFRIKKELGIREICKLTNYDSSNWSKIERGKLSPPNDEKILKKWGKVLGIENDSLEMKDFVNFAQIAQGIIPSNILNNPKVVECLPAFFRTLDNKKPKKEDIDKLIELLKKA